MKFKKKTNETIFFMLLIMLVVGFTGCQVVKVQDGRYKGRHSIVEKAATTTTETTVIESPEEMEKTKPIDAIKNNAKALLIEDFKVENDKMQLPRYNTIDRFTKDNTVSILYLTGSNYLKDYVEDLSIRVGKTKVDFDLHLLPIEDGSVVAILVYQTDAFRGETVDLYLNNKEQEKTIEVKIPLKEANKTELNSFKAKFLDDDNVYRINNIEFEINKYIRKVQ